MRWRRPQSRLMCSLTQLSICHIYVILHEYLVHLSNFVFIK
jgi:hypothetical protein